MGFILFSSNGSTPFQQLLGHNKAILEQWTALENCIFSSDTFSTELKEEVRRILAFSNNCEYCMAKGTPSNTIVNPKTQTAIHIAGISNQISHMTDKEFSRLKAEFTDSEISELIALICFITACQRFGALLNLTPNCPI